MIVAGIGLRADATEADLHAALALTPRKPFRRVSGPGSGQDHLPRPPHCASPVAVPN